MNTVESKTFNLPLNEEEQIVLEEFLERALEEIHVEKRRTEAPAYREQITHQEATIRALTERVKQLPSR
jgi:hypothetical protein